MNRNVILYVQDILSNMCDTEEFIKGMSYDQFTVDKKTFNAVVRAIEVIGEAAKRVPDSLAQNILPCPGKRWPACAIKSSISISALTERRSGWS